MKYVLLFFCTTILSGCSWWTNFYVINYSTEKIKVQFVYKSYLNGRHVFSASVNGKSNINVATLDNGVYTLTIKFVDRVTNKKLVIAR